MDFLVDDVARIGLIRDQEPYKLPKQAWNYAENVSFRDNIAWAMSGYTQAFGSLSGAPYFLMPAVGAANAKLIIYASLAQIYATDGTSHATISSATAPYHATAAKDWNGTVLGGIPIINSGNDRLQAWGALSLASAVVDLPNWNSADRAKVIRAFGPYLVAFGPKKGGTTYQHGVWWSHPADPGSYPSSWDTTDPTKDTGFVDLPDTSAGIIYDALPLRGQMYIYKEHATWVMRFIGGSDIFSFDTLFEQTGLLTTRCVAATPDGRWHFVAASDDIFLHNGQTTWSLLDKRMKRTVFNAIDSTNYGNSFVFAKPSQNEMWFCYPESGQTNPSRALVWNYGHGTISETELGALTEATVGFQCATYGDAPSTSVTTWASVADTWATTSTAWSVVGRNQTLIGSPSASKIYVLDDSMTRAGSVFDVTLRREGLGLTGGQESQNLAGTLVTNFARQKIMRRVWIDATGQPFLVRVGYENTFNGETMWTAKQTFTPGTDLYLDFAISGLALAIEFSSASGAGWGIVSYKLELVEMGRF